MQVIRPPYAWIFADKIDQAIFALYCIINKLVLILLVQLYK